MFADGMRSGEIAARLRVTPKSVRLWRRRWKAQGEAALVSKGPGGAIRRLDVAQIETLQAHLDAGPAMHGWDEDQRWTLSQVSTLIYELFRVRYSPRGVSYLLHRIGWSPQVPVHHAVERDEDAAWVRESWPGIKGSPQISARGSCSPAKPANR